MCFKLCLDITHTNLVIAHTIKLVTSLVSRRIFTENIAGILELKMQCLYNAYFNLWYVRLSVTSFTEADERNVPETVNRVCTLNGVMIFCLSMYTLLDYCLIVLLYLS